MADSRYQAKVYRKQGGNELIVMNGGVLTLEAGATFDASDGTLISEALISDNLGVRNETGGELAEGTLVYVSGWNESEALHKIVAADADDAPVTSLYILQDAIANNANGTAYKRRRLTGVNTAGATVGDPVYLSTTAGGWSLSAPRGGDDAVVVVGRVAVVHAATGEIEFNLHAGHVVKVGTDQLQALAVTASQLASDAVTTAKVLDANITSPKLEAGLMQFADVQLTNAEMLALNATPKALVGAPGANKVLLLWAVYMVCDAAAGAYTESADNLAVEFADGTDVLAIETTGFIDQAAVEKRIMGPTWTSLATPALVANSGLQLKNSGNGEFGGGNAANTFSVRCYYSVVDTIAFT